MLVRFIIWIIVVYIIAKILGVVLQQVRIFFGSFGTSQPNVRQHGTTNNRRIEDVDYEDVSDKQP
jgi:hypothetical protein